MSRPFSDISMSREEFEQEWKSLCIEIFSRFNIDSSRLRFFTESQGNHPYMECTWCNRIESIGIFKHESHDGEPCVIAASGDSHIGGCWSISFMDSPRAEIIEGIVKKEEELRAWNFLPEDERLRW